MHVLNTWAFACHLNLMNVLPEECLGIEWLVL